MIGILSHCIMSLLTSTFCIWMFEEAEITLSFPVSNEENGSIKEKQRNKFRPKSVFNYYSIVLLFYTFFFFFLVEKVYFFFK